MYLKGDSLIAIYDTVIEYDAKYNSYSLVSIQSGDVKDTNELNDETRSSLVQQVTEFSAEHLHADLSDFNPDNAIVDKHNGFYFPKFLDEEDDNTTC